MTSHPVLLRRAADACGKRGAQFAVPRTCYEAQLLDAAMSHSTTAAWLAYRRASGGWRAGDSR